MRVGVDAFTLRDLHLDPMAMLDYCRARDLAGVQIGWFGDAEDAETLSRARDFRAKADALGLYTEVGADSPNPHVSGLSPKGLCRRIAAQVGAAAACGWHELHSWCGGPEARWESAVPWPRQLEDTKRFFQEIAPVLRDHGSRLNLEPKGGLSTFEAVEIVEAVGPDVAGVCLDTANVLCFAEDPVSAARRVAPYTHMTHCKDAIVYFCDKGLRRQVRPPGGGVLAWDAILSILAEHTPGLMLSIEDHKWLYDVPIFTDPWHEAVPQMSARELGKTVSLAWQCQRRIDSGALPDPDKYEKVPHADEMESRLLAGRDYLNDCLARLGLADPPA